MDNLVKINDKLIKVGGVLMRIKGGSGTSELVAGLYDESDNLVKSWDQLVSEGLVTVE